MGQATRGLKPQATTDIYDASSRLWETADELRANSHLKAAEYAIPVLGLIFLKFADSRFSRMESDIAGEAFGKVYEYFLGKFATAEGAKGGEYFTPTSIVRLIVEIIEPFKGKILDPACGSGGMFVQSARFVEEHRNSNGGRLSIYGQERVEETLKLCKMNLAVHGLEDQVSQSNTYYEDPFKSMGQFDFVMANPPFNVNKVDKTKIEGVARFPMGLPKNDNAYNILNHALY